jgi:hypothetical protein
MLITLSFITLGSKKKSLKRLVIKPWMSKGSRRTLRSVISDCDLVAVQPPNRTLVVSARQEESLSLKNPFQF